MRKDKYQNLSQSFFCLVLVQKPPPMPMPQAKHVILVWKFSTSLGDVCIVAKNSSTSRGLDGSVGNFVVDFASCSWAVLLEYLLT